MSWMLRGGHLHPIIRERVVNTGGEDQLELSFTMNPERRTNFARDGISDSYAAWASQGQCLRGYASERDNFLFQLLLREKNYSQR